MNPPGAEVTGSDADVAGPPPAGSSLTYSVLRHRADFLRAASARRQAAAGFLVQARARGDGDPAVRVGFTCSKKIGNAVARNRAKRRLREVARAVLPALAEPGWDYVLVGRPGVTVDRLFADLICDMETALRQIHKGRA
jgi:ribonuclease P protein component